MCILSWHAVLVLQKVSNGLFFTRPWFQSGQSWSQTYTHPNANSWNLNMRKWSLPKTMDLLFLSGPFPGEPIMANQPTLPERTPLKNKGWIAGLTKGNLWVFISPDHKTLGDMSSGRVGWPVIMVQLQGCQQNPLLLMEEILHHLGCIEPCK